MMRKVFVPIALASAIGLAEVSGHSHEPHDEVKIQLAAEGLLGVQSMISNSTATATSTMVSYADAYIDYR